METVDRRSIHEIDVFGSQRKLMWIPREKDGFRNPNSLLKDPPIQKEPPRFHPNKIQGSPARGVANTKIQDGPARGVSNNEIPDSPARAVSDSAASTAVPEAAARKGESVRRVRTAAGDSDKSRVSGNLLNSRRVRSVSPHPHEQSDSSQGDSGESDGQKDNSTGVLIKPGRAVHHHVVHTITEDYEKEQMLQSEQSPAKFGDSSEDLREVVSYLAEGTGPMSKVRNLKAQDPRSKSFSALHTRDQEANSDVILRKERRPGPPSRMGSPSVAERSGDSTKTQIETGCTPTIPPSIANRKLGLQMGSKVAPLPEKRESLPMPPLPSETQAEKSDHPSEPRVALSPLNGNEKLNHPTPSTNSRKNRLNSPWFEDDAEEMRRSFSGFAGLERGNGLSKRFPSKGKLASVRGNEICATFPQDAGSMSQRARDRSSPLGRRDTGTVKAPQPSEGGNDKDNYYNDRRQLDSHVRHPGARARGRSQRIGEPGKSLLSEKSLNGGSKRYSRGSQSCRCPSIASPLFPPGEEDESLSHIKTIVLNSSSEAKNFQSLTNSVSALSSDSSLPQSQDLPFNNKDQFPFPTLVDKWKHPSDLHFPIREKMISDSQRLDEKYFLQEHGNSFSASKAFDQDIYGKLVLGTGVQDHLGKSGRAPSRTSSSVSQSCSMITRRGAPRSASPAAQLRRWIIDHFTSWSKVKIKKARSKPGTGSKSGMSKEETAAPANSDEKTARKKSPWRRIIAGGKKKKNPSTAAKAATIDFTPEYPGLHQSMRFVSARFDNGPQPSPMSRIGVDPQTQCRMTPLYTESNATPSRRWMFMDGNGTAAAATHGHRLSNVEGVGYSIHPPSHRLCHMEGIGYSNPAPAHRMNRRDGIGYSTPSRRMMMYAEPELQGDFYEPHLTAFSVTDTPGRSVNGTPAHRLMYIDNDGYITPAHRFSHREAAVGFASPGSAHHSTFTETNGNATPGHRAVFVDGNGNVTPAHRMMYVDINGNATPTANHRTTKASAENPGKTNLQAGSAYRKAYMLPPIPSPSPAHFHAQRVY